MATIKSYTDLPQSQRLAEILNHESADMRYEACYVSPKEGIIKYESHPHFAKYIENCIPCWSLAALLNVLSKSAYFASEAGTAWLSSFKATEWCVSILNCGKIENCYADNQVDACYEMILKLNELNLL